MSKLKLIVTGGLGFIGSNFIRYRMRTHPEDEIINVDKVTYASNPINKELIDNKNYKFIRGDISDYGLMLSLSEDADIIINFAAESHVDNSIQSSDQFLDSNILGVHNLLKVARDGDIRFHQISTDEVFGSLPLDSKKKFTDKTKYDPRNPYSATKASADFLVRAFHNTYGVKATISNCSNNYGEFQHPEKLIPKTILSAINNRKVPLYGKGHQIRDWIHVTDHCSAISLITDRGKAGTTYLVGGNGEMENIKVVTTILDRLNKPHDLIEFVQDRPGHDVRYAIRTSKSLKELGWKKKIQFDEGIQSTIEHYQQHKELYEKSGAWMYEWK